MNHKERIDAVMNQQPTDRTPFTVVDGGAWIAKSEGKTYNELYHMPDGGAAIIAKYLDDIDTDTISGVNGVFTAYMAAFGCPIDIDHSGSPVNTGSCIKDVETEIPALDITKIREKLLANDFVQCMINQCKHINEVAGAEKYIHVDIAGPFTAANVMCGTAEYMVLTIKHPDLAKKLLDYATAACIEILKLLGEVGANIAFIAEPCSSGTMISPKMMKSMVIPRLQEVREAIGYKYIITHVCGASGKRTAPLKDAGINAFSCDYLVDLEQALVDTDGKMVIFGNMNPSGAILMGTPDEVYDEACERIKTAAGRGFILAPGCDLGCDSPKENIMMMSKACKDLA